VDDGVVEPLDRLQRAPAVSGRTLTAYLLLPRPADMVKAFVLPLTFGLGVLGAGGVDAAQLLRALVVWAAMELLIYQARYQWNDVRGFAADQVHPDAVARGRLPGPGERGRAHIAASVAVATCRLLLTAGLALLFWRDLGHVLVTVTVAVFGVAAVYEWVRSMCTGRTAQIPPPLHPALVATWIAVGAGYAVRGVTGLALAVELDAAPALAAASCLTMWAVGTAFVTCRWSLEAMPFARLSDGQLLWQAQEGLAREHTLGLVRWLPPRVDRRDVADGGGVGRWRALHGRTPLHAPWNVATVIAAAGAAATGHLLVDGADGGVTALLAAAGVSSGLVVVLTARRRALAALAAASALALVEGALGLPQPLVAVLPMLAVLLAHASFTSQCQADLGHPLHRLQALALRTGR